LTLAAVTLALMTHAAYGADAGHQEDNKKIAMEFYDNAINQKDFEAASKYLGPVYIQHNQNAADGREGLKGFIRHLRDKFSSAHSDIKRVFADGDYMILHVHAVRV
jgi:predicted SnoaL-like aldol condensation-catalyzing enzyme